MSNIYNDLIKTCMDLANNPKLPAFMADLACDLYDQITNPKAQVLVEDLMLLNAIHQDHEQGLSFLDSALSRRR
jgi:hypothetical protein